MIHEPLFAENVERADYPECFGSGADWRLAENYPPLRTRKFRDQDFFQLAWEVLRRTHRYRWHHFRLERAGQLGANSFKGNRQFFTSSGTFIGVPGWEDIALLDHFHRPADPELSLGEYREKYSGQEWVVVHGTYWVKSLWGISDVPDPFTAAADIDLESLFSPSRPHLVVGVEGPLRQNEVASARPAVVRTVVSSREALIRVRLDQPIEVYALAADLLKAVRNAQISPGATLPTEDTTSEAASTERKARVRDEAVQRAGLWLRIWDWRQDADNLDGRANRSSLKEALERDFHASPPEDVDAGEILNRCLSASSEIDKLLDTAKRYIELNDTFYRGCIGRALIVGAPARSNILE